MEPHHRLADKATGAMGDAHVRVGEKPEGIVRHAREGPHNRERRGRVEQLGDTKR